MSVILALLLIFALAACGGNGGADDPAGDQVKDPVAGAEEEPVSEDEADVDSDAGVADGGYVPEKEFPKDAPVYPGAVMVDDGPYVIPGLFWRWFYETDASANEIVEYFIEEFKKMGFEIDEDLTGAEYNSFVVSTAGGEAQVYHVEDEHKFSGEVTPDTPGREYYLMIASQEWNERMSGK